MLTSQLFLPDALSEYLYTAVPAYQRAPMRVVLNRNDSIAQQVGPTTRGALREERERDAVSLTAVVDPQANPPVHRPGPGMGPPPGVVRGAGGPPPGFGGTPPLAAPVGAPVRAALVQSLVPGDRAVDKRSQRPTATATPPS